MAREYSNHGSVPTHSHLRNPIHIASKSSKMRTLLVDDDASPRVLETMEAAANIHVDDTITLGVGLSSNTSFDESDPTIRIASFRTRVTVDDGTMRLLDNSRKPIELSIALCYTQQCFRCCQSPSDITQAQYDLLSSLCGQ